MVILQFEHTVPDFAAWKQLFDRDPLGRQQSGARRVRLVRPIDEPGRVMVELDFDSAPDAAAFQDRLQSLWDRNQDSILQPRARTVEVVETHTY